MKNLDEARESERLLRKAGQELNVQPKHVPAAVKNLLNDINKLQAKLEIMEE